MLYLSDFSTYIEPYGGFMSQNRKKKIIHPIAIDLGAKATGVYTAHYVEGTELSSKTSLNQKGKIYQLEKDAYTLLMRDRTAQRHQKRGFDRRQMVKRLFKLIWCERFGLEWNSDIQQTISFLLNRRGFSFLTEQYNAEILSQFPTEVYNELPEELPKELPDGVEKNQDGYDFDTAIQEWTKEGQEKLDKIYEAINKEPNRMASRQVFISRTKEIKKLCTDPQKYYKDKQNKNKSKLSDVSRWIIEEWQKQSSHQQTQDFFSSILKEWDHWKEENETEQNKESAFSSNTMNFIKYLEDRKENIQKLKDHLPEPDTEDQEIKNSFWNFKSESFKDLDKKIEENAFDEPEREESKDNDYQKKKLEWKKTHLNHLAFAIYQNLEELKSGGRHRSKYFEEVKNVLEYKNHSEKQKKQNKFLKVFCDHLHSNLHSKRYKPTNREPLTVESLTHLIGHLSNLELKPLRKYFNDFKHQEGDYWCEKRLNKYFDRWLDKQWRVTEKDKDKSQDEAYDYNKLKKCWKTYYDKENKTGSVIDFWLREDPKWTIPPYQNNNNRRPPHCQSLILNPVYLDSKYPQWQEWLSSLKELSQNYLEDFESELKGLQSGQKKPYFNNQKADQLKKDTYKRNQKNLDARILQFIFDRVKKDDPLNLNEIFSHAKKIKQLKRDGQDISETKSKLEDVIKKSELPDHLETTPNFQTDDLFEQKSFLHLLCKYYKLRQRAKDGRLFIHPRYRLVKGRGYEDTGRFEDRDCLLTYCNHKPRQKRYQLLKDLAAVLQISNQQLEKFIDSQDQNPNAKNTDNKKQPENQKRLTDDKVVYYLEGIDKLKTKGNNPLQIQKLHNKYKQKLFGTTDHQKIMKWIEEQIGHGKGEDFKFGKYTNLINLTSDEQRAFRHALFLTDHELHQKVIDAISSRSKTFVNGTQPHFAQVLANNFYKKAKRAGWQDQICFDWFGVEAQSNTRGDGIYDLRKDYEKYSNISEFKDYAKEGNSQKPYSHLIDATLAFAIAVDQHKKEGSLKLNIDQNIHLEPMNRGTGEVTKNLIFNLIKVPPNQLQEKCLEKRKAYTVETHHRQLLSQNKKEQIKISYKIHRDNSIGERFFPLIQNDDGTIQKGFHPKNAVSYQEKDFHLLRDQEFLIRSKFSDENYQLWFINKKKAQEFLMDIGIREADKDEKKQAKLLDGLSYQTIKTKIQTALTPNGKKEPQTVKDAIDNWSKCIIEKKNQKFISKDKILLPFYSSWEKLKSELDETDPNQSLQKFLQQCLLFRREEDHQHPHQKVKKVYSLPILTTIGNIRLRRNTWDRKTIIQTVSDDSLAKYGLEGKDRPHTILSQNSVPKKHYSGLPQSWNIEPIEWMTISQKDITDSCIQCAKVRHKDSGRCDAKITMNIADIGKISIPFISKRDSWKGKIKLYEDKENFKKAKETNRSDYHLMSSDFQWFSQPFKFPKDRNEVKIKSFDDIVTVEFTIPKTTQVKQWLLNNKTS